MTTALATVDIQQLQRQLDVSLSQQYAVIPTTLPSKALSMEHRSIQLTRLVVQDDHQAYLNIRHLITTLGQMGSALFVHVASDGKQITFEMGVKKTDLMSSNINQAEKVLSQAVTSLFSGVDYHKPEQTFDWLDPKHLPSNWSLGAVTLMPSVPDVQQQAWLSALEHTIGALKGRAYHFLLLADPVNPDNLSLSRSGLQEIHSLVSPLAKHQLNVSQQQSVSHSVSKSKGTSDAINQAMTKGTAYTKGSSFSVTKGTSESHSSSHSYSYSDGEGNSESHSNTHTTGTSESKTAGVNQSHSSNQSATAGRTQGVNDSDTLGINLGTTDSIGKTFEMANKKVIDLLELIDHQLERLQTAQAKGGWMMAGYFIGNVETVQLGMGVWQGCLQGDQAHIEQPKKRVWNHTDGERDIAFRYLQQFQHPMFQIQAGKITSMASLLTTDELATTMHLPKQSFPGLPVIEPIPFAREVIRIDATPDHADSGIIIGQVHHLHQTESLDIRLNEQKLSEHLLVTGTTGVGKTTSITHLLAELHKKHLPWCVIEPAKNEYRVLANLSTPKRPVQVFDFSHQGQRLCWNPFAFPQGIALTDHVDRVCAVLNAAFPMYASMPQLLEKAIFLAYENLGWNLLNSQCIETPVQFPTFGDVIDSIKAVLEEANYAGEVRSNFEAALVSRLESLCRGALGITLNSERNACLANHPIWQSWAVFNLSHLGSREKKAVVMGLLFIGLQEARQIEAEASHSEPKDAGQKDIKLKHLMVLEEAHNLLQDSHAISGDMGNAQAQSIEFFANALAEMRALKQGFAIVDQSASALDISVIKNTNTRILFRAPDKTDRETLGGSLGLTDEQTDHLARIENFSAIVKQSDWLTAVQVKLSPYHLPEKRNLEAVITPDVSVEGALLSLVFRGRIQSVESSLDWASAECREQFVQGFDVSLLSQLAEAEEPTIAQICPVVEQWLWITHLVDQAVQSSVSPRGVLNALMSQLMNQFALTAEEAKSICHALSRVFPQKLSKIEPLVTPK